MFEIDLTRLQSIALILSSILPSDICCYISSIVNNLEQTDARNHHMNNCQYFRFIDPDHNTKISPLVREVYNLKKVILNNYYLINYWKHVDQWTIHHNLNRYINKFSSRVRMDIYSPGLFSSKLLNHIKRQKTIGDCVALFDEFGAGTTSTIAPRYIYFNKCVREEFSGVAGRDFWYTDTLNDYKDYYSKYDSPKTIIRNNKRKCTIQKNEYKKSKKTYKKRNREFQRNQRIIKKQQFKKLNHKRNFNFKN